MNNETKNMKKEHLPKTKNGALKVELVPMPSGDNPWRTRADYVADRRQDKIRFYILLSSFVVSIIAATISWGQMVEARKERIKTEEVMRATKEIAQLLVSFSMVDYGIGYTIHSFKVREIASPYLYAKVKDIAKLLDIPADDKVNVAFRKWASLKKDDPAKESALNELEKIIIEQLK
jgi:hypothetical protein